MKDNSSFVSSVKKIRNSGKISPASLYMYSMIYIQDDPGKEVYILEGHSISHSKQKSINVHVSCSEQFPRYSYFTVQYIVHCTDGQHAMSSHELQSALMLTVEFSKMYYTR
jgi:hypothetical protein